MSELERLALGCLFPGFAGYTPPDWIRRRLSEGLGGVVLYAWNVESPQQVTDLAAALRLERPDVLVAIDEEGGDVTRLETETGSSYPGNAALGAIDDVDLTERVGEALGADLAAVGVDLDLAPVADVNTNPQNPIIGIRSFGSHPDLVARHVAAFVRGLQSAGVAACAKHFPGHGDTSLDSHLELARVDVDREAFLAQALPPFRAAIEAGVRSIMTAHILVSALDDVPATTSRAILTGLLREELGFEGMTMTDALEMRAISTTIGEEEGAVRALAAGADAFCLGHDLADDAVERIVRALVEAVSTERLSEGRLVEAAARVGGVAEWRSRAAKRTDADRSVGAEAARRALRHEGDATLHTAPLVVELRTTPSIAAGESPGPAEWLRRALPGAEVVRIDEGGGAEDIALDDRALVVLAHDAHRHAWQRAAIESLLATNGQVIVIEVGLPYWRPNGGAAHVATHGAARVNLEAAAELLLA
jgi:beta-N-acetylhexosaminidase